MTPSEFFKCLADDTRLQCLLLIALEGELCVCELTEALQQIQPKISRHLSLLRQQHLLEDRRAGQWVFYRLHKKLLQWQLHLLISTAENNPAYLKAARQRLTRMTGRPDRVARCC